MGLIEIASGKSVWRGMEYYNSKKVEEVEKTSDTTIDGTVRGENLYRVHVDIAHPRKSTCTCPFADGRRVVCKHMIDISGKSSQIFYLHEKNNYDKVAIVKETQCDVH